MLYVNKRRRQYHKGKVEQGNISRGIRMVEQVNVCMVMGFTVWRETLRGGREEANPLSSLSLFIVYRVPETHTDA